MLTPFPGLRRTCGPKVSFIPKMEEGQYLVTCEFCKRGTKLERVGEYEKGGEMYVKGLCPFCGRETNVLKSRLYRKGKEF